MLLHCKSPFLLSLEAQGMTPSSNHKLGIALPEILGYLTPGDTQSPG